MANRYTPEQIEHDAVVKACANTYDVATYTNPGNEHNYAVNGVYPDVVVPTKRVIEEIETANSVNWDEREQQWKTYAQLGYTFHLIVPLSKVDEAKKLVKDLRVDRLEYYKISGGVVSFGEAI